MADTSARILRLLTLLGARHEWRGADLATRLEVSTRTLRRDIDTLRDLGYPVAAVTGPSGGYRLGVGGKLPPLLLDDDQAVAVALALQTAPATVSGIDDAVGRALTTLRGAMPARLRAATESLDVTTLRNYWEFAAPPLDVTTLQTVGEALRTSHELRFLYRDADEAPGARAPGPLPPVHTVEPHRLVVWAGRWYLLARDHGAWRTWRVDRMEPRSSLGRPFERTPLEPDALERLVVENPDRGDTSSQWPCVGSAVVRLPAGVVARWAPGGSVVDALPDGGSRLTIGAWSWAGVAGLLATFDTDLLDVEPEQLRGAFGRLARRSTDASTTTTCTPTAVADPTIGMDHSAR